jgi:hypothetical protein
MPLRFSADNVSACLPNIRPPVISYFLKTTNKTITSKNEVVLGKLVVVLLVKNFQNAGQNYDMKTGNRRFESVAQFTYLETTITNENLIWEEDERRLNSGIAC